MWTLYLQNTLFENMKNSKVFTLYNRMKETFKCKFKKYYVLFVKWHLGNAIIYRSFVYE